MCKWPLLILWKGFSETVSLGITNIDWINFSLYLNLWDGKNLLSKEKSI